MDKDADGRLRLSRASLSLLLLGVLIFPPATIAVLYATLSPAKQQRLKASVSTTDAAERLPTVEVCNVGETSWRHVRLDIDGAFYYLPRGPVEAGEAIEIPLSWFAKKSGHRFRIDGRDSFNFRVTARLPGNARGVHECVTKLADAPTTEGSR